MKINPEPTIIKNSTAIPKTGSKYKKKASNSTDKPYTSTAAKETNSDENTIFDMETDELR